MQDFDTEQSARLMSMSFTELLELQVKSGSGFEESLRDAPATIIVITSEDIKKRGYTDITQVMEDLPGFDTIVTNGTNQIVTYQRGYRTPFTQRTLFMIDGKTENQLWSHAAPISRQYPLSFIDRIEVLYGPASAVYGPNAFLGVINIITKKPEAGENNRTILKAQWASFNTRSLEFNSSGAKDDWRYNLTLRKFLSDEAGLEDYSSWGFASERWLNDELVWGPILNLEFDGEPYGEYHDRSNDFSLFAELGYKDFTFGASNWTTKEGYGLWYAFDKAQPNQSWNHRVSRAYVEHNYSLDDRLSIDTLISYKESRIWGGWAEATADWNPGLSSYSYVSVSSWNSISHSRLFKQDYLFDYDDNIKISAGIKHEKKELTRAYNVCGYWADGYCSIQDENDLGPEGLGAGIVHSSANSYTILPGPPTEMPAENLEYTIDRGIYLSAIYDRENWRLNLGVRYDKNSIYGSEISPRLSVINRLNDKNTLKIIYGEAFQEPSPLQLFGGWQGRAANPNLGPEFAQNLEMVYLYEYQNRYHSISIYKSRYENVIKESALNTGDRDIFGMEISNKLEFQNPIKNLPNIELYAHYTYTDSQDSETYNHSTGIWEDNDSEVGDIAKHKVFAGVNIPIKNDWHIHLKANWIDGRGFYSRNPLRAQNKSLSSYTVWDINFAKRIDNWRFDLKVRNLFNKSYFHPGVESANSGDDFSQRSLGFNNSVLPQVKRHFSLMVTYQF